MDLSNIESPSITFDRWFFFDQAETESGTFTVTLSDGVNNYVAADYSDKNQEWTPEMIPIDSDLLDLSNIIVEFKITDFEGNALIEGGVDKFEVIEGLVATKDLKEYSVILGPNPFDVLLSIQVDHQAINQYRITDLNGQLILEGEMNGPETTINTKDFLSGFYIIQFSGQDVSGIGKKIIKF